MLAVIFETWSRGGIVLAAIFIAVGIVVGGALN